MLGGIMRKSPRNTFVVQDERSETVHNPKAKLKTLYAMRILQGETDAERGLLLREIIECLGDCGMRAECKAPTTTSRRCVRSAVPTLCMRPCAIR